MAENVYGTHHVGLKVSDFDKSKAFFIDVLGMKPYRDWGEGDKRVSVLRLSDGSGMEIFAGGKKCEAPDENAAGDYVHLAFAVKDCDTVYKAAIAAGCTTRMEPKDMVLPAQPKALEGRVAFVYGFDGEVLEFMQEKV